MDLLVKQIDIEKLYDILYQEVYNYYYQHNYANISFEKFKTMFIKEIISSKFIYDGSLSYKQYIKERIIDNLNKEVKKAVNNKIKKFSVLNNYLNKNFKNQKSYQLNIKLLNNFELFLNQNNCILTQEELMNLIIKNENLNNTIKVIFEKNKVNIISGKIDKLFSDEFIKMMIKLYCLINNIEIDNEIIDDNICENNLTNLSAYLKKIIQYNNLTREEELNLFKKIKKGDKEAREIIIKHNLRLVVNIAKKNYGMSLDFIDLIQDGNIGLMKAIDNFDYKKGYKFSTYATYIIDATIKREIVKKGRVIKLPDEKHWSVVSYKKVTEELVYKLNREPSNIEIANKMGISLEEVYDLQNIIYQQHLLSIDAPISNNHDCTLQEILKADIDDPETMYKKTELSHSILKLFKDSNLTEKEIMALKLRFGFNTNNPMTLEEISQIMGITKQRVSQILKSAMKKFNKEKVAAYLEGEKQLKK